jgi:REP element-mobilizing transposase RayT
MHPPPWGEEEWCEYNQRFGEQLEKWLDAGYETCALGKQEVRQPVVAAVRHDHGHRAWVHHGVVMPNHVHLILEPFPNMDLSDILQAMKSVSSRRCNRILGRKGRFWMDESYDHIIRSQAQYEFYREYIRLNPVKAGLTPGMYEWL